MLKDKLSLLFLSVCILVGFIVAFIGYSIETSMFDTLLFVPVIIFESSWFKVNRDYIKLACSLSEFPFYVLYVPSSSVSSSILSIFE